jgi:hypothetical protein
MGLDASALAGLSVRAYFGGLWDVCPPEVLLRSPALATGLAVAVLAHRGGQSPVEEHVVAETACRLRGALAGTGPESTARFYAEVFLSIVGGAGYVEPGGRRLNVQQLLPPQSLLLALAPGIDAGAGAHELDAAVEGALALARERDAAIDGGAEKGVSALFGISEGVLDERQTAMLYGLLRVREMVDGFLEYLGEPFVDNDRLAEICDEESAILTDYFGFPARAYASVRTVAGEAGALGAKLTWAFGGYPAAIIVAPGRRGTVQEALQRQFADAHFLPVDTDSGGLLKEAE